MVCLKIERASTPAGVYSVGLFLNGIDYEVSVLNPGWRWTLVGRFDPEQRDRAHECYASTLWAMSPAI